LYDTTNWANYQVLLGIFIHPSFSSAVASHAQPLRGSPEGLI